MSPVSNIKQRILKPFLLFKGFSRRKKLATVFVVIVLAIAASSIYTNATKKPDFQTAVVTRGDITEVVTETGSIVANGRTDVFSPTNGIISEVFVRNGEIVTEGQDLFTVDSSATQQEQSAAYANYLTAVASLNAAEANLNAYRAEMYAQWDSHRSLATNDTYETGDGSPKTQERESAEFQISQDKWLAAEATYKDQQTVVSQASAQVSSTWLLYQATQNATVKAPIGGTVANLSVSNGSSVHAPMPTLPVKPVLAIANAKTTEIVVSLSETDIAKISEGQRATVDVSAINDTEFKGNVTRVDNLGTDDQGVIRYNVYIEMLTEDERLRPGMTVDVDIITNELTDVLTVPNQAVRPYQGGRAVRVYDKKTKEIIHIPVKIGIRGTDRTEILEGLTEGQEVITALSNEQIQRPGLFGS